MRRMVYVFLLLMILIPGCGSGTATSAFLPNVTTAAPVLPTPERPAVSPALTEAGAPSTIPAASEDVFTQMGIILPAPVCDAITQPQMEGPYYKAGSPERNSLIEEGLEGTRFILTGYVLDQNCQPLPNAWLDFWQADANGEYDNAGYRLRGHQYTDAQGRYYLETILPGLYASRPIEHIHVKVQPEGGAGITSQLYFPNQPVAGLTVTLEDQGDRMLGYFNFVIQK